MKLKALNFRWGGAEQIIEEGKALMKELLA